MDNKFNGIGGIGDMSVNMGGPSGGTNMNPS